MGGERVGKGRLLMKLAEIGGQPMLPSGVDQSSNIRRIKAQ
jgi:hypothetical protein